LCKQLVKAQALFDPLKTGSLARLSQKIAGELRSKLYKPAKAAIKAPIKMPFTVVIPSFGLEKN
jgi:hypothetical protein